METRRLLPLYLLFMAALSLNAAFSVKAWPIHARWSNVPSAPTENGAIAMTLGDRQLGYRMVGFLLQNFGNGGGDATNMKEYNYGRVSEWLFLTDKLDPRANFAPSLAAFYFGNNKDSQALEPLVDYLAAAGRHDYPEKWRWMAQAVYFARFRAHDMVKAAALAQELANMWQPGMPAFVKQMPALVANGSGDKKMAYGLMLGMMKETQGKISRAEMNSMIVYTCESILTPEEEAQNPLCLLNKKIMPPK